MKNNELHGLPVLVHPDLDHERRGQAGVITYAGDEDIYVSFKTGKDAAFSGEKLFILKNKAELFPDLIHSVESLELKDFKDLYKISQLQDMGRGHHLYQAVELVRDNPAIRDRSMVTVASQLERGYVMQR